MFGEHFLWGVSMCGFQFEMGDLKRKSLDQNTDWFKWVHDENNIRNKVVSGDFPEDGVNYWELYERDHEIAKSLGMNAYRIGIEWSRIFPESTINADVEVNFAPDGGIARVGIDQSDLEILERFVDNEALRHYENVIDDLKKRGFKVIVCLNHFTLPLWVHDPIAVRYSKLKRGPRGWYDTSTVVEFVKYAAFMAWKLSDMVDIWATFNEPMVIAEMGYVMPESGFPPGLRNDFGAFKRVASNLVAAHARAFDLIKKFDSKRADSDSPDPAWVGVIHNVIPVFPHRPSERIDIRAAEFIDRMHNTFFLDAITSGWLDINFNGVKDNGEVKHYLRNRMDWLGVNYYTRNVTRGKSSLSAKIFAGINVVPELVSGYGFACKPRDQSLDGRPTSDFGWEFYPEGIARVLVQMSKYERPMYVTENGVADENDQLRPLYVLEHIRVIENLIEERRLNLNGYLHWALTDNYEWAQGFKMRFGLLSVDLRTKERQPRRSAEVFRKIIESGTTQDIRL